MALSSADTIHKPFAEALRGALRALGNLLLGAAIGLAGYYWVTDLVARMDQTTLRDSLGASPLTSREPPAVADTGPKLDFSGWAEQDAAAWKRLGQGGAFGRLVSGRMGLDTVVVKGTARADLARGPGWITSTDLPGPTGNCGISGHRTTFMAPFRRLDRLRRGDTIDLYSAYRLYRYEVSTITVVTPDKVEVVAHTEDPRLTLTACHPPYSARYRLIVQSRLVEVRRLAADQKGQTGP